MPFWSPDGSQIAFFADGKLERLDLRGGPAQTIGDAPTPRGGAWGPDGQHFVALRSADDDQNRPLTLVTNWTAAIGRR